MTDAQKETALRYKTAGKSLVSGDTVEGLFTHELGHHVQWTMLDPKTTNSITSRMLEYAPKISGYATADKSEYLAESFVAYMKGERHLLDDEYVKFLNSRVKTEKYSVLTGNVQQVSKPLVFTIDEEHSIIMSSKQRGKKFGKHCSDYGLDPSSAEARAWMEQHIQDILTNFDIKVPGEFSGQGAKTQNGPNLRGEVWFYVKGRDVVVVNSDDNEFVTVLKDGIDNSSVKEALSK